MAREGSSIWMDCLLLLACTFSAMVLMLCFLLHEKEKIVLHVGLDVGPNGVDCNDPNSPTLLRDGSAYGLIPGGSTHCWLGLTAKSFIICTITYLTLAILGYLIYGQNVQSQVTLNLPTEKVSSKVAIYTVIAIPIAKFALTVMPIATAIENGLPANYQDSKPTGIIIRVALLVSTVVCATGFVCGISQWSITHNGCFQLASMSLLLEDVSSLQEVGI
ncbi:hypothetical protein Pint_14283 [Pistacia integerrima]|uniref:Uncharacterized protein n=1 Tax=Pistacia integerrima TaxID=434235 RepID=A0ACC0Y8J2_9ROSI|nr:hypothetical protein Pint_14283 [Pistacia integerrima]